MKKTRQCIDCHFLISTWFHPSVDKKLEFVIDDKLRESGPESLVAAMDERNHILSCYRGVWDAGFLPSLDRAKEIGVERICEWHLVHRPGMLLPAAVSLQERIAAFDDMRTERRLTIWGLFIAAGALLLDVLLRVIGL